MLPQVTMFDKMINLHLHRKDGSVRDIMTPETGRKQTIRISGTLLPQGIMQQIEIRITNLNSDVPLSDYDYIAVEAGYKGGVSIAFRVQVLVAYQELPGPDGITYFKCLVGNLDTWRSATVSGKYLAGSILENVVGDLASKLNMDLEFSADNRLALPIDIFYNGLAKDLFPKLVHLFSKYNADGSFAGIVIAPYGNKLLCFPSDRGTGIVHVMQFISHAKHSASGYDINAPWIPPLRPGDTLQIDPKWFRQDFGGSLVAKGNLFQVFSVDFEFDTEDTNTMTVLTMGAA